MFAGEGTPERTNRRFHYSRAASRPQRLSTAFDSVTLYGEDPARVPTSTARSATPASRSPTLDDAKKLYSGFDLCRPDDLGVDDDQRSGADDPRLLHERRDRPAVREVHRRERPVAERGRTRRSTRIYATRGLPRPRYQGELPRRATTAWA